jgi:hypothetical protein
MTAWQISPGAERVELKDGQAEVVFTVTNPGPVDKRATVDVVGSEQAQSSWFKIAEPQQLIPHGGSKQFMATVKPDEKAPAGTHWLAGRVYSADAAPEEDSVTSDRVTFEIKPLAAKPKPKWWLWASIAAGLLAVVIGVVLFLVLPGGGSDVPDVTTKTQADAEQLVKDRGLVPNVQQQPSEIVLNGNVISQDPPAGRSVKKGSTVTIVVSTGSDMVPVPQDLIGKDFASAFQELKDKNLVANLVWRASLQPRERVLNIDPTQGNVHKGSEITLYVSTGQLIITTLEPPPSCIQNPRFCVMKP